MKITWVTTGLPNGRLNPNIASSLASVRYRITNPSVLLEERGNVITIINPTREGFCKDTLTADTDVLAFSKLVCTNDNSEYFSQYVNDYIDLAEMAKKLDIPILFDLCDNVFVKKNESASFYLKLISFADVVTVNSKPMGEIIHQYANRDSIVIDDPVEGHRQEPSFAFVPPGKTKGITSLFKKNSVPRPIRILWFGNQSNLDTLQYALSELTETQKIVPVELHIVTAPGYGIESLCEQFNNSLDSSLTLRFTPWSRGAMQQAFSDCDIVIIPSLTDSKKKFVKSANRLLESFWAGRFVVANPLPAYLEFMDWAWISEDIATGIRWAISHADEVTTQIREAQDYIASHYTPEVIARKWEDTFHLCSRSHNMNAANSGISEPVRLNLGCGDKILPGYLNVDVAESRSGKKPDILCDLHRLDQFADNSVDEILSVHVIEHFWRWEVVDILKEWVRVLKPGGKMILECPNLLSACQEFLKNPELFAGPGQEAQRTMWVFYGDPKWNDPLMVHRWGYTPSSLETIMVEAGLCNVIQQPAQFKLREPRDMRLVGYKQGSTQGVLVYSRKNPSPRYLELLQMYHELHEEGYVSVGLPAQDTFSGFSLPKQASKIKRLINMTNSRTILDYGSGKGRQYQPFSLKVGNEGVFPSIQDYWGVESIHCYDPAYTPYNTLPEGRFDGVITTDVLEHCPEEDIDWILDELFGYASKFVYANIASYPANKILQNGENAHVTILPPEWWREKLEQVAARYPHLVWEVWIQMFDDSHQLVETRLGNSI